jgi:Fic family protein
LRLVNVTAGYCGRSYLAFQKVPKALLDFCHWLNNERQKLPKNDIIAAYRLSFLAHYRLVSIHPWADGNGRMSRLVMNMLQYEYNLIPVKVLKEQKSEYIQALNDTRDSGSETIFPDVMLRLHNQNLQTEINAYKTSINDINVGKDVVKELSERQRFILEILAKDSTLTIPQMSGKTAATERTIQRDLQYLQQLGILRRIGGRKEGYWEVIHPYE